MLGQTVRDRIQVFRADFPRKGRQRWQPPASPVWPLLLVSPATSEKAIDGVEQPHRWRVRVWVTELPPYVEDDGCDDQSREDDREQLCRQAVGAAARCAGVVAAVGTGATNSEGKQLQHWRSRVWGDITGLRPFA